MGALTALWAIVALCVHQVRSYSTCPGALNIGGVGSIVPAVTKVDTPGEESSSVEVTPSSITPHIRGRAYFSDTCTEDRYNNTQYTGLDLLGKTLRYTVDLSGLECGCNAAFYLVSMRQNEQPGNCNNDYYCDANSVCGVKCAELDIQEANQHAWHTTLHTADDPDGKAAGYGGGSGWEGPRDFTSRQYSPGGECIDTTMPFQVSASFPTGEDGALAAVEVTLSQEGKSCPLTASVSDYKMHEMGAALAQGMTPVVSYWSSDDMLWLDGRGSDSEGGCPVDRKDACPETVSFRDFSVRDLGPRPSPTLAPQASEDFWPSPTPAPETSEESWGSWPSPTPAPEASEDPWGSRPSPTPAPEASGDSWPSPTPAPEARPLVYTDADGQGLDTPPGLDTPQPSPALSYDPSWPTVAPVVEAGCPTLSVDECCQHQDGRPTHYGQPCVLVANVVAPSWDVDVPCQPYNRVDGTTDWVGSVLGCGGGQAAPQPPSSWSAWRGAATGTPTLGQPQQPAAAATQRSGAFGWLQNPFKVLMMKYSASSSHSEGAERRGLPGGAALAAVGFPAALAFAAALAVLLVVRAARPSGGSSQPDLPGIPDLRDRLQQRGLYLEIGPEAPREQEVWESV